MHNREEFILKVEKYTKEKIYFKSDRSIGDLVAGKTIDLIFTYNAITISFAVEMNAVQHDSHIQEEHFIGNMPEFLYKNLDRSYSRVSFPPDMELKFSLLGQQYILPFPQLSDLGELALLLEPDPQVKPKMSTFKEILDTMAAWIQDYADGYKVVLFQDGIPLSFEEQLISKSGKALFLPTITNTFPQDETYPTKYLITEGIFTEYLKSTGVNPTYFEKATAYFLDSKKGAGIRADLWIPMIFEHYVVGSIRVWIKQAQRGPLAYTIIEPLYRYAHELALALKEQGYFDDRHIKDTFIPAYGVDISVSGLRFIYPVSPISASMTLNSTIALKIITPQRTISINAQIVRCYKKKNSIFFGCNFLDIIPEDVRFLFEYIYGKPFTEPGVSLIAGHV
ncbi:MAG: PilZ domain-containing protein [Treponema sp.]|nr:PilZ domain-containing protein [Treponema sp.]